MIQLFEDRILVEADVIAIEEETTTASGIIAVKQNFKESDRIASTGTVIDVGPGKFVPELEAINQAHGYTDAQSVEPMTVKAGDRVTWSKYGGSNIVLDGKPYLIMRQSDIVGILPPVQASVMLHRGQPVATELTDNTFNEKVPAVDGPSFANQSKGPKNVPAGSKPHVPPTLPTPRSDG